MQFQSRNPFTDELLQKFEFASTAEIELQLRHSAAAFELSKEAGIDVRISFLSKFNEQLLIHKEELAQLITLETAKPIKQARQEIDKCLVTVRYFLNEAKQMLATEMLSGNAQIEYYPLGVIFGIMPWNYPVWQVLRFAIPCILAGNVVLIKHAPSTPQCSLFVEKLFSIVDSNQNYYKQLFVAIPDIEQIIADDAVAGVSLTGSTNAGRAVAQLASKYLKKCVLELGGSDPFIVCADAILKDAVLMAFESRCRNNGQSCIAAKRFIINEAIYERFIEQLIEKLSGIAYLAPTSDAAYLTSLARNDLREKAEDQVRNIIEQGYTLIYEYKSDRMSANTIFPMIFAAEENAVLSAESEELFAPIFLIAKFNTLSDALKLANATSYGLSASVWSQDADTINFFTSQIEAGMVYVNEMSTSQAALPFGGIKNSGMGKELGALGIREFTNQKLIFRK